MNNLTILQGDCREVLTTLPDESVQCCVTSPPYWGLRDYGTATWEGGEDGCDHLRFNAYPSGLDGGKEAQDIGKLFKDECGKCGAKRIDSQIGLEPTPQHYVSKMVAVFREVRRVLRGDGTCWLNLGDSYCSTAPGTNGDPIRQEGIFSGVSDRRAKASRKLRPETPSGLKPKDLVGIPWRVAFALQEDGWYLRSDIIWHKPNSMPESVTDRPTRSHEYLFLLTKSDRYYYDAEAIKEPASDAMILEVEQGYQGHLGLKDYKAAGVQNPSTVKERIIANARKRADAFGGKKHNGDTTKHSNGSVYTGEIKVNKRSVWTVTTAPYYGAHFATFPPDLIKPCILAGCPVGGVVLDPFGGSGTTGMVALEFGRQAILIELNPSYVKLAEDRCNVTPGLAL